MRLRIYGLVQGVNFRYLARQRAQALGLSGWVQNCPDGTVEALAQGSQQAVDHFLAWARRGPSSARVDRIEVEESSEEPPSRGFVIH